MTKGEMQLYFVKNIVSFHLMVSCIKDDSFLLDEKTGKCT